MTAFSVLQVGVKGAARAEIASRAVAKIDFDENMVNASDDQNWSECSTLRSRMKGDKGPGKRLLQAVSRREKVEGRNGDPIMEGRQVSARVFIFNPCTFPGSTDLSPHRLSAFRDVKACMSTYVHRALVPATLAVPMMR